MRYRRAILLAVASSSALIAAVAPLPAQASLFSGETADAIANVISWIALFIAPTALIVAFWLLHIMPEKIAEKRRHPQAKAIQALCIMSLFFGGLLWPFAFLWAYSKPVLYKLAYGTDEVEPEHPADDSLTVTDAAPPATAPVALATNASAIDTAAEMQRLRLRLQALESQLASQRGPVGGDA
ncbi:DUF3302 domain-containing protein [Pseudoxanthomonas dokdonensis]|uniref:DUF3302 domain-containing protein n=1 Tax=Pseudoxanthomonas dokdonensis TaxID=344882 RepID=UPI0009F89412|nr:DUF3302 domain-containing protein [Pseudoxanthomonas dokdonensis]